MLPGIGITCFAGSYAVLLAVELISLRRESQFLRAAKWGWAVAGFFAHTAFLYYHVLMPVGSPLSSQQGWLLILAWLLVAAYLHLSANRPRNAFGPFILPIVLGIILAATYWADASTIESSLARRGWASIHGASLLFMTLVASFGFVTGLMFLEQSRRLKKKRPLIGIARLPSLEWLQRANSRSLVIVMVLLAVGVFSGAELNRLEYGESPDGIPFSDPIVLGSVALLTWLVVTFFLGRFHRPMRNGRRIAVQTLFCFLFLLLILGGGLLLQTRHWRVPEHTPDPSDENQHDEDVDADESRRPTFRLSALFGEYSPFEEDRHE
jgi:ABC-type uncharacterized transport system permease subunit